MPKIERKKSKKNSIDPKKTKKKKSDSNTKINQFEKELGDFKDKHLRLKAEFENFRRRKAEEISRLLQFDGENVIRGFLTIVDDLERMIKSIDSSQDSLKDGILLVETKIQKYLESLNVESFGNKGDRMDPDLHDAMLTQSDKKFENDIVLEVYEKGYTYREKVIRHAKVIVNKK